MAKRVISGIDQFKSLVGETLGTSDWVEVTQQRIDAFADHNNREQLDMSNDHIFAFRRDQLEGTAAGVLVMANFDVRPQAASFDGELSGTGFENKTLTDLCTGETFTTEGGQIVVPRGRCLWLSAARHT